MKQDILATLSYFDIFDYPLTQTEIMQYLNQSSNSGELSAALYELASENWIYSFDECYSLKDDYRLVLRRRSGYLNARKLLKKADRIAAFLSVFPFVRGIAVSGSLSKNYADEDSDIDFFIITARNRLWICRTLLHCFKKLTFLVKKQHLFCMNYFVDEDMLQIKEKNLFTATEIMTLLPLRGIGTFQRFYEKNKWSRAFLPNYSMRISYIEEVKNPLYKRFVEFIFNNPGGRLLDLLLMNLTSFTWSLKSKRKKLNSRGIIMSMDISRHYAKPDPDNFQKKLLQIYETKILNLFHRYKNKAKSIY